MAALYQDIIYRPLLNGLVFLYNTIAFQNLGLAIVLLTILVRLALYPLFHKQLEHTTKMQALQPKLQKIKAEHKGDKEKEMSATMDAFRDAGTNPFVAIGLTFAQMPVLIGLYSVFAHGLALGYAEKLYSFIHAPNTLNTTLFGLINLQEPNTIIIVCAAAALYFQARLTLSAQPAPTSQAKMTTVIAPLSLSLAMYFFHIPSAVGIYIGVSALAGALQQYIIGQQAHTWKTGTAS